MPKLNWEAADAPDGAGGEVCTGAPMGMDARGAAPFLKQNRVTGEAADLTAPPGAEEPNMAKPAGAGVGLLKSRRPAGTCSMFGAVRRGPRSGGVLARC